MGVNGSKYNYIENPKSDGYRGIHDVYIFKKHGSPCNGLKVEIQYRTITQHVWSTTDEALGMISGDHLKFGDGSEKLKQYFQVTSEIFSRAFESSKSCLPSTNNHALLWEYINLEMNLGIIKRLRMFRTAKEQLNQTPNSQAAILTFVAHGNKSDIEVKWFRYQKEAVVELAKTEEKYRNQAFSDVLFVQADSFNILENLFPNYFIRSSDFCEKIDEGINLLLTDAKPGKELGIIWHLPALQFLKFYIRYKFYITTSGYLSRKARIQKVKQKPQ